MTHNPGIDETRQPLLAHLVELRTRLLWSFVAIFVAFCVCYYFAPQIYGFLVEPLAKVTEGEHRRLIYTGLAEAFVTYLKLAFWAACMVAFPVIAVQIWMFVAPGLYRHEKRAFLPFLIATPVLFLMGAALAYYFVMPAAWKFFLSFEGAGVEGALPIQLEARVAEYLSMAMTLIFGFGISFELPVLLVLLVRAGVMSASSLAKGRRYAIVLIFALAAVATPPDVFSQIALALPLMVLYEISVLAARLVERDAAKEDAVPSFESEAEG